MIRALPIHTATPAGNRPAHTVVKRSTTAADFHKLIQPAVTSTAKPATASTTKSGEVPHLGPFTGDPDMHPAPAPPKAPDPITSSPYLPAGYKGIQDLMNKAEVEQTMNDWLQNYTKWSNDNKTQIYQQAMANWQLNDQRCGELGLAAPPKPTPPTLDPVQSMPPGWWYRT